MQKNMKDKMIFADKDKFSDRLMQPDSTAFHRYDSLSQTLTDKKENIIFPRFAFLKIYKKSFAALLFVPPCGGGSWPATSKRVAILLSYYII